MKLHLMTAAALALVASPAAADGLPQAGDCPHVYKAPPKRAQRKPPVKKPVPPAVVTTSPPCHCTGDRGEPGLPGWKGDVGDRGPAGPKGDPGISGLHVRLGVMGSGFLPHKDWAWGPALQLTADLNKRVELALDGGVALPLNIAGSPGRESGLLLHAGLARYFRDGKSPFGLTLGVHYTGINGSSSNGEINGRRLALDGGVVIRKSWDAVNVRFELAPAIGGLRGNDAPGDTRFTVGLTSSAFIGVNW